MRRSATTLLLVLLLSSPDTRLDQLARSGTIQQDAPLKTSAEITVNAPREKVWKLLTGVSAWPTWQRDITKTDMFGPLQSGTAFSWTSGIHIQSQIALVQPPEKLAWTGTAYKARAIHVWTLQELPGDCTLVKTEESMAGFLASLFYSSRKLEDSDRRWLNFLKVAAER